MAPTFALEPVSGGGEQESVSHGLGAAAAGDARFLVPCLHPLRQPAQVAVAVQWVGSQCPGRQNRKLGPPVQPGPKAPYPWLPGKVGFSDFGRLGVSDVETGGELSLLEQSQSLECISNPVHAPVPTHPPSHF